MRKWSSLLAILVLASGCRHEPSLVGKWTGDLQSNQVSFDFEPDETVTVAVKVGSAGADITGRYKVDPRTVTLDLSKYKLKNVPQAMVPMANSLLDGVIKQPFKATYHFNSDDEVAVTYNGKTDIWKRVKEGE